MDVVDLLGAEFRRRCERNPRYSVRGFALWLGVSHSTISRLLRGKRRISAATAGQVLTSLGIPVHQTRDAMLVQGEKLLADLVAHPAFRPDSRWLAVMTGLRLDDVNVVLHRLLSSRRLVMAGASWRVEAP